MAQKTLESVTGNSLVKLIKKVFFAVFVKCFFVSDNFDFFTCKVTPGLRDTSKRLSFSQRCSGKWDIKNVVVSVSKMELCISSLIK